MDNQGSDQMAEEESMFLTGHGESNDTYEYSLTPAKIQHIVLLSILIVMSFIGNSLIILILTLSRYHKHLNRVNIYIINLAIGDLAVCCITMTSELIDEIYGEWMLGHAGCKIMQFTQIVALSSTTYILVAMSWDRYQAICRPLDFNPSSSNARKMVSVAWIAALISAFPYLFIFVQVKNGSHEDGTPVYSCVSEGLYTKAWQRKVNFIWLTCSVLIVPAVWIAFCYFSVARVVWQQGTYQKTSSIDGFTLLRKTVNPRVIPRAKIKTIKMSLTIVISFVACWTPYFVVYNIIIFSDYKRKIPETVKAVAETLALLNSALNPIIYGMFHLRLKPLLQEGCNCCSKNKNTIDQSRASEPTTSTAASILRAKAYFGKEGNKTSSNAGRLTPRGKSSEQEYEFVQSNRHIWNKRSQHHQHCHYPVTRTTRYSPRPAHSNSSPDPNSKLTIIKTSAVITPPTVIITDSSEQNPSSIL